MTEKNMERPITAQNFVCLRCGGCCRGEGYVILTHRDVANLSAYLDMTPQDFLKAYTWREEGIERPVLTNKNDAAISCIFLEPDGCRVNPVKPHQCATFPFEWTRDDALEICRSLQEMEAREADPE